MTPAHLRDVLGGDGAATDVHFDAEGGWREN
jgi:hypothetical protein